MIKRALPAAIALALINMPILAQDLDRTATTSAATSITATDSEIEEIAVIGRYVPDEKRSTSALSSVLSNEEFARSGDTNIAEGLKRVAGISLVGGKYVYVRGLGERYSSALLNGSSMPSPERWTSFPMRSWTVLLCRKPILPSSPANSVVASCR